jgi:hypothetical protein
MRLPTWVLVAVVATAAGCGDRSQPDHPRFRSLVVVMSQGATEADGNAVVARCGGLPGADGGEVLMTDRHPGELRLALRDGATSAETARIRDCLTAAKGVDVERSMGFPEPL